MQPKTTYTMIIFFLRSIDKHNIYNIPLRSGLPILPDDMIIS